MVQYDQFHGDALTNNLVTLDTIAGKVYDVPNRTQSPYVLDTAVLMSVLTQKPAGNIFDILVSNIETSFSVQA